MYEAAALCPPFSAKNQMALALKVLNTIHLKLVKTYLPVVVKR